MAHQLSLGDDLYRMLTELASAHGQTPDEALAALVDEAWEHECAPYDAAFHSDSDWQQSARDASHRADGQHSDTFDSTAELFQALGADAQKIEKARILDDVHGTHTDSR